mmetsp:Transcript_49829/g.98216  ORF Transcript_49829/g.98216 Transcript_49829/m.98216 type:complete len:322 (-) Transcript_49829:193-1158(-)
MFLECVCVLDEGHFSCNQILRECVLGGDGFCDGCGCRLDVVLDLAESVEHRDRILVPSLDLRSINEVVLETQLLLQNFKSPHEDNQCELGGLADEVDGVWNSDQANEGDGDGKGSRDEVTKGEHRLQGPGGGESDDGSAHCGCVRSNLVEGTSYDECALDCLNRVFVGTPRGRVARGKGHVEGLIGRDWADVAGGGGGIRTHRVGIDRHLEASLTFGFLAKTSTAALLSDEGVDFADIFYGLLAPCLADLVLKRLAYVLEGEFVAVNVGVLGCHHSVRHRSCAIALAGVRLQAEGEGRNVICLLDNGVWTLFRAGREEEAC